ncbi:hypothetical protein BJ138DRAFT_1167282 [Hygrophoropsis aurantiaca]|uniref:Uncharacterized protein n=1 Tax=Hygrophoropsis aurantiaca TaxID=72124 RepID=A0ACB7ZS53_9AGAM|nr:hypothetical protein BJ138DRAFT_1167282 [Hygrophoropsis aurantiaca]
MHQALLIADIQHCIFDQISSKQTLSALARTCQALTEGALDILWRDLDCFTRLIECMPHDLWTRGLEPKYGLKDYTFELRRPISSSDWAVFQKYSLRVRSIQGPSGARSSIKMDGPCILSLCSPSAPIPLLPNVTSLVWAIASNVDIVALSRLIPPHSTSLRVHSPPDSRWPKFQPVLPIAVDQIRLSIKHFAVDGDKSCPKSLLDGMKRSLRELQSLETLWWNDLGSETIVSLTQLPALRQVRFEFPSDFAQYVEALPPRSQIPKLAFSKLCGFDIVVTGGNLASVTAFLNYFDFSMMEKIHVSAPHPSQSMEIQEIFATLASSQSCDTIRDISIMDRFHAFRSPLTVLHPLGMHELRPLLQFSRLQRLRLSVECPIALEDAMLIAMATAWPHLSLLYFNYDGPWHPGSHITPLAFVKLLECCPKLERLGILMDFSAVDYDDFDPWSIEDIRTQNRKGSSFSMLELKAYRIVHPHAVALFFAAVLPNWVFLSMADCDSGEQDPEAVEQSFYETGKIYRDIVMNGE